MLPRTVSTVRKPCEPAERLFVAFALSNRCGTSPWAMFAVCPQSSRVLGALPQGSRCRGTLPWARRLSSLEQQQHHLPTTDPKHIRTISIVGTADTRLLLLTTTGNCKSNLAGRNSSSEDRVALGFYLSRFPTARRTSVPHQAPSQVTNHLARLDTPLSSFLRPLPSACFCVAGTVEASSPTFIVESG